ncbi:MAG: sulfatase [Candidatus Binatia bacterium]
MAVAALTAAWVLGCAACEQRRTAPGANVLLIVVDTLRADHLGCYGYAKPTSPRLDALALRATRFDGARATSSWTLPSVASLLTGLYPAVHGAERSDSVLPDGLGTLATDLDAAGYETAAFSANPAFVTPRQGLAHGFERFDVLRGAEAEKGTPGAVPADASFRSWVLEANAETVTSAALDWLGARNEASRPFLLYLHYFDPHAAYTPPEEYARRFGVEPGERLAGEEQWRHLLADEAPDADVMKVLVSLYDAEIAATDAAVGRLLDGLPAPLRESTIVVVTSDHGEEFGDHGGVQHGRTLHDELLRVPLLIAGPQIPAGKVVTTPVSLAGLRATLADLLAVRLPADSGAEASFEPAMRREPDAPAPVFADLEKRFEADRQLHRRAMVEGNWKLLVDPARSASLFDVATDPGEKNAVLAEAARTERMLADVFDRDVKAVSRRALAPPRRVILDPAKREQLKALGYLQ